MAASLSGRQQKLATAREQVRVTIAHYMKRIVLGYLALEDAARQTAAQGQSFRTNPDIGHPAKSVGDHSSPGIFIHTG